MYRKHAGSPETGVSGADRPRSRRGRTSPVSADAPPDRTRTPGKNAASQPRPSRGPAVHTPDPGLHADPGLNADPAACARMARTCADEGRFDAAKTWCRLALDRDSLLVDAHYTQSLICQAEGDLDGAIEALKKTIYLDPEFVLGYFNLANLYRARAQPKLARRHQAEAVRLVAGMDGETEVPGSDGLNAEQLMSMMEGL